MDSAMTKSLTEGSPFRLIAGFSVPVFFGYLFQQFYNVVDTVIVGQFLGKEALAAVGATGSVNFLVIGFCMGVCSGFSIPVAQKFGARQFEIMRRYVVSAGFLAAAFAAVMAAATALLCRPLLVLMRTPENIIGGAAAYIRIIFIGIPVIYLYNITAGIIRALGDSRTPLCFLVCASVLNIALDLFFIIVLHLGVAGAALATVISQGISGLLCLLFMFRKFSILRMTPNDRKIRPELFPALCGQGVPMGLQYSITAIGSVILQASVNTLGSDAVAAVAAATKISMFFATPFDALGTTMATWGGQNTGAGKFGRLAQGLGVSCAVGAAYSLCAFGTMALFGSALGRLFLSAKETGILEMTRQFLVANTAFYFPLALVNIVRFLIQGMGFSRFAVLAGVFEMAARTAVGVVFVPLFGYGAVCFASPAAWIMADCFLIPAFFHCLRTLVRGGIPGARAG